MQCHKCPHFGKFVGQEWAKTPCAECMLRQSRAHVREFNEVFAFKTEMEDTESMKPYEGLTGTGDEPMIPLSVLCKAMACWISLTLPAREVFKLRMCGKTLGAIAEILRCSKQTLNGYLGRALRDNPVLAALIDRAENKMRKAKNKRKAVKDEKES